MRVLLTLVLALAACRGASAPATPPGPPPNIVLFVVDDLGWGDAAVRMHERSPQRFVTPALADLARHGLVFTDAHAQAVCTPSRLSMLTGLNSTRHGATNWVLHADGETSGSTEELGPPPRWNRLGWRPGTPTLPGLLRERGYRTIHVGKAHFAAIGTPGADPLNLGFDVNVAGHAAGAPGSYQGENGYDKAGAEEPSVWAVPGLEPYHGSDVHLTDALTREALTEVDRAVATGQPFYLHLAHYAVHTPIEPHARFMARYGEGGSHARDETEARYASMVEGVDASLGALVARLEELDVAGRTLIVFTSDNGGLSAHARGRTPRGGDDTHNWPLREGKGSAYEGGTRVPLVFAWARADAGEPVQRRLALRTGERTAEPTICEDLFTTLLSVAGAAVPADVDGLDLTPVLDGRGTLPERALVFHYPHVWGPRRGGYQPHSAIRRGRYAAVWFYAPRRWELYDLETDLSQERDLAAERPEVLASLASELRRTLATSDAALPLELATGEECALPAD